MEKDAVRNALENPGKGEVSDLGSDAKLGFPIAYEVHPGIQNAHVSSFQFYTLGESGGLRSENLRAAWEVSERLRELKEINPSIEDRSTPANKTLLEKALQQPLTVPAPGQQEAHQWQGTVKAISLSTRGDVLRATVDMEVHTEAGVYQDRLENMTVPAELENSIKALEPGQVTRISTLGHGRQNLFSGPERGEFLTDVKVGLEIPSRDVEGKEKAASERNPEIEY